MTTARLLRDLAARYERPQFIEGDPSFFMHQVEGAANVEATAFVASAMSFGSRAAFMPKIAQMLDMAHGDMDGWIRRGAFGRAFPEGSKEPFYRFFDKGAMNSFFTAYRDLMRECGTLGEYVRAGGSHDALSAVKRICAAFGRKCPAVPNDAKSACKRVCMFLRWMARDGSPVDVGLWSGFIRRESLIVPLDTHVMQEAARLGLMKLSSASMSSALRLTAKLAEIFPGDPCRGDFALFGYGVDRHVDYRENCESARIARR